MNKTTEKILMSPVNLLVWMSHNTAEVCLMGVFICSILTFFIHIESPAMIGGYCSFSSVVMVYIIKRKESKEASTLYNILGLIVLITGVASFLFLQDKKADDVYSPLENFLCTYAGGIGGLMVGAFLFGMIEKEREGRKEERRMETKRIIIKTSIPATSKSDKVAIRDATGEKIIGHIEKEKYDDFINKNLIKNEHEQGKENKA